MKKGIKRVSELKKLENRRKILSIMFLSIEILLGLMLIGNILIGYNVSIDNSNYRTLYLSLMLINLIIFIFVDIKIAKKIRNEKKLLSLSNSRKLDKEGNLKRYVKLKDKELINTILSSNIQKLELQETKFEDSGVIRKGSNSKVIIYLKNGDSLPVYFSENLFLNLLDEQSKQDILNRIIESIKVQNAENKKIKITITGRGIHYENSQATESDLLEMFESKN